MNLHLFCKRFLYSYFWNSISKIFTEGLEKIRQLESRQTRKAEEETSSFQKPVFTLPIQNVEKEENQNARFAARLIPVGDASLKVEWFKDGKLLSKGNFEFFYNIFIISYTIFNIWESPTVQKAFLTWSCFPPELALIYVDDTYVSTLPGGGEMMLHTWCIILLWRMAILYQHG